MKKIICIILMVTLCIAFLSGCQQVKSFDSTNEMKEYLQGTWKNDRDEYYVFDQGRYRYYSRLSTTGSIFSSRVEGDAEENLAGESEMTFEEFCDNFKIDRNFSNEMEFDCKKGIVSIESLEFTILDDGTIYKSDEYASEEMKVYNKISDDIGVIDELANECYNEFIFDAKYRNLPNARAVQYDKYGHIFEKFIISGEAELDDYYNYNYENYEYSHFCINICPSGGSYSDEWYIYASREEFADLYTSLQGGPKNVDLVAQMIFVDTGSNNMATLIDYK